MTSTRALIRYFEEVIYTVIAGNKLEDQPTAPRPHAGTRHPEPGRKYAGTVSTQQILLFVIGITAFFAFYEFLKTVVLPGLTMWESHMVSIVVVAVLSALFISWFSRIYREHILHDITERRQAEEVLKDSEARLRLITDNMLDIISQTDTRGFIQYISPSIKSVLGYEQEERLGKSAFDLLHPDDRESVMLAFENGISSASSGRVEVRYKHKDGHYLWLEWLGKTLLNNAGNVTGATFMAREITERREAEERLKYLSFHDILTGLYNRSYFEEEIKRLDTKRQTPLSIIMGDINGLKIVNDTFGHQEGDRLLIDATMILKKICRKEDIVCRFGGDEFAVLLPKTKRETAERICNRLRKACEKTERELAPIRFALGVATREDVDQTFDVVLRDAEHMMYRDKPLDSRSTRFAMITSFQRALAEKSAETLEHGRRIQDLVTEIGNRLSLSGIELGELNLLAALHDIGQIAIPADILMKPCYLTEDEWELMKRHPEIGERIARSVPDLVSIAEAILSHHERWDGTGYPRGLKGEQIPLLSRIFAIADTYDVMTNGRPYKKAIPPGEAVKEIEKFASTQFDPELVKLFVETLSYATHS